MVWSNPDTRKATVRYLCICPTTQQIHQGAENVRKTRPEESFAKWNTMSRVQFLRGRFCFSPLQACGNDCTMQYAYSDDCCGKNCVRCGRSGMISAENCGRFFIAV